MFTSKHSLSTLYLINMPNAVSAALEILEKYCHSQFDSGTGWDMGGRLVRFFFFIREGARF